MKEMLAMVSIVSISLSGTVSAEIKEKDLGLLFGEAKKYKKEVAHMLNELAAHHPACRKYLSPYTAGISKDKSTPGNPSFFVQCGNPDVPEVVRFDLKDINANRIPSAKMAMERNQGLKICTDEAKSRATIPSSVDAAWFFDVSYSAKPNGNAVIGTSFKASNALGVEQKFQIYCFFEGQELASVSVKPAE
jgi:hypothetical protein